MNNNEQTNHKRTKTHTNKKSLTNEEFHTNERYRTNDRSRTIRTRLQRHRDAIEPKTHSREPQSSFLLTLSYNPEILRWFSRRVIFIHKTIACIVVNNAAGIFFFI